MSKVKNCIFDYKTIPFDGSWNTKPKYLIEILDWKIPKMYNFCGIFKVSVVVHYAFIKPKIDIFVDGISQELLRYNKRVKLSEKCQFCKLQTVPGSHLFTFVKSRYQIEFNALRFHIFFQLSILRNFSQLF